jgi:uncharacterized membrane protein
MSPHEKTYNEIAGQKISRIESISDGVFAVALTLLVLDLKVPISEGIKTEGDLFAAFCAITPQLLTYFLSFMTLGIFWTGHSTQFNYIHRSDRNLNWISLFFLMLVALLPFTTAFLSKYVTFKLAVGVYWLNILLLGLAVFIQWRYAFKHNFLNVPDTEKSAINKAITKRIVIAQSLYAFGASLCFINTYLSIGVIIAIQLNYAFPTFFKKI